MGLFDRGKRNEPKPDAERAKPRAQTPGDLGVVTEFGPGDSAGAAGYSRTVGMQLTG